MSALHLLRARHLAVLARCAGALARACAPLLLVALPAAAQQADGSAPLLNRAQATYQTTGGNQHTAHDSVFIYIARGTATGGLTLEPPGAATLIPGARHSFAHVLRNGYLASDLVRLFLVSPGGLPAAIHADVDGDGLLGTRDTLIITDLPIAAGAEHRLLVTVDVPLAAPAGTTMLHLSAASLTRTRHGAALDDTVFVARPALRVGKVVVGDSVVDPGSLLTWRIWYQNTGADAAGVQLVDTLPAGLTVVNPGGAAADGQVLSWNLGAVARGDSAAVEVTARLATDFTGDAVVNSVHLRDSGTERRIATARHAVRRLASALNLSKRAEMLEASVGEMVAYTITVTNEGAGPLARAVVRDVLPPELRLVMSSVTGADTTRMDGTDATFILNGPLLPGAQRVIRYMATVTSRPRDGNLVNRATVEHERTIVLAADTARATTRVRQGTPVESRTIIGKVWVDRDGDGRQDPDEGGVPRVPVWGVNGEVVVTDADGRFSFRDVVAGTHAVRVELGSAAASAYTLARGQDPIVMVRADGWTTPQVNFRLVPLAPARSAAGDEAAAAGGSPASHAGGTIAETSAGALVPDTLRIDPLRSDEEGAAEAGRAFISGPAVTLFAPFDGYVGDASRIFVGVKGEAGRPVALFIGERLVREGVTRGDGVHDFLGVDIAPGPQRIRVRMQNSWGQVRWDSIAVHRSSRAAGFELPGALTLRSDEALAPLRIRVVDSWGVPVGAGEPVTIETEGVVVEGKDADLYSVGEQRHTLNGGWLLLELRGAAKPGQGRITLRGPHGPAQTLPVRVLPVVGALVVTGAGEIGIGKGARSFGAVSARGALDAETAVILSFDSRRHGSTASSFGGDYDPLDEARYPILGDASERRVTAPSENALAVRVERGFDWFEAGDVETSRFTREQGLFDYRRAVNGLQGQLSADHVQWRGFASLTRNRLEQVQVRADGSSGPYGIGAGIRPGTERIRIEVRAADNAARVISRQPLQRYTDYEIDQVTGAVLLRRPVNAADAFGNPVYVVADVERAGTGTPRLVGGLRAQSDLASAPALAGARARTGLDSAIIGGTVVLDETSASTLATLTTLPADAASRRLAGFDAHLVRGRLTVDGELLHATTPDSTDLAGRFALAWGDTSGARLTAAWTGVGAGFADGIDPRLRSGTRELQLAAITRLGRSAQAELRHGRQSFARHDVTRATTSLRATQELLGRRLSQDISLQQDEVRGSALAGAAPSQPGRSSSMVVRVTAEASEQAEVWVEAVRRLRGVAGRGTPGRFATGTTVRIYENARLEASHQVVSGADGGSYTVTSAKLRTDAILGTRLSAGLDRSATGHASHAAVLGIDRQFRLTREWSVASSFERRFGLEQARIADPVRALPYARSEPDQWAAATTLAYAGTESGPRLNVKSEVISGEAREGYRFDVAGDLPLGGDGAILTRHNWSSNTARPFGELAGSSLVGTALEQRSLIGFAFRPTRSDALNMIAKVEWNRAQAPMASGAFSDSTDRRRFIGAADAIWTPASGSELAVRYAIRYNGWAGVPAASGAPLAHYVGSHLQRSVATRMTGDRLAMRLDGRYLHEQASGVHRWSAAPSALFRLTDELQLEAGYRLGRLSDDDFGGGSGAFLNLGMRFTEGTMKSAASFWRDRL